VRSECPSCLIVGAVRAATAHSRVLARVIAGNAVAFDCKALGNAIGERRFLNDGSTQKTSGKKSVYIGALTRSGTNFAINENVFGYAALGQGSNTFSFGNTAITAYHFNGGPIIANGTATNDDAGAGKVGEFITSVEAGPISMVTGDANDITSVTLTAGDWDVEGMIGFDGAGSTTVQYLRGGLNTTTDTLPSNPNMASFHGFSSTVFGVNTVNLTVPKHRISIASTTTVYLVGQAYFGTSTCTGFGKIEARRVR